MAMAKEQHPIRTIESECEPMQVVVINGSALPRLIAIVTMGEVLLRAPKPMGLERGVIHGCTNQPIHIGAAVVEPNDQAPSQIPTIGSCRTDWMVGRDAGALQQMADPQHIISGKHRMVPAHGMVHPCFIPIGEPEPQALLIQSLDLTSDGLPQPHQVIPADVVTQWMGVQRLKRVLMMERHGNG